MASSESEISFRRITSENVSEVCELSETLSPEQREMVADNGVSIAEGFCSQAAWFRAIYLDETLVGFVMVNDGDEWDDGIECDGPYLWRLMIAGPHQSAGVGRRGARPGCEEGPGLAILRIRGPRAQGLRALHAAHCSDTRQIFGAAPVHLARRAEHKEHGFLLRAGRPASAVGWGGDSLAHVIGSCAARMQSVLCLHVPGSAYTASFF